MQIIKKQMMIMMIHEMWISTVNNQTNSPFVQVVSTLLIDHHCTPWILES